MTRPVYGEPGRFPPRHRVRPDGRHPRDGRYAWRRVPLDDLHLATMADAYPHGRWLGGGGSTRPLRVRRAEEFMRRLGELGVRSSGGPEGVARHTPPRAAREGVPLWMARRSRLARPVRSSSPSTARRRTRPPRPGLTLTLGTAQASLVPLPDRYGPPQIAVTAPGGTGPCGARTLVPPRPAGDMGCSDP
ncbi:hypothetical protein [Streptomyces sp. NPDC049879]|uniref:hypothetical protein n=1 Tax=Streptomyces sp. NPDC049879 TaxID=3365598 RepID=UPI00379FF199